MNIMMVSSETVPFSKSGGLADVVGALSKELANLGNTVSVFMPLYGSIDASSFSEYARLRLPMLGKTETVRVMRHQLDGVSYLALSHPLFTGRKGIYGDTSFAPYPDNLYRFCLMCKAAVEIARRDKVEILHAHDWTAGPAVYLAKEAGLRCRTVMTIHNLAYMGDFPRLDALRAVIRPSGRMLSGSGLMRRVNFLKTGLEYADRITTVSPSYAKEIQEPEQGCGIDWLLRQKAGILSGVINGIDTDEWDPEKDAFTSAHFSSKDLGGKARAKAEIQRQFGLDEDPDIPLVAMISRLAEQKGFGPLLEGGQCTLERLLEGGRCQFIVIGTGDKRYEEKLRQIASRHRNISVNIVFSQALSHVVEAGSDFFLMPSKYEPCGLNQMYSLRYGTLPIAHRTGGLRDTITDLGEDPEHGDGFLFDNVYCDEIIQTVNRALDFYRDKDALHRARVNAMACDFSWKKSAQTYESIYKNALGGNQT